MLVLDEPTKVALVAERRLQCVLSIAIVTYLPDRERLKATLTTLSRSLRYAGIDDAKLYVVDNSPRGRQPHWLPQLVARHRGRLLAGHGNVGFGRAHNLVLAEAGLYHLVLNPDVELCEDAIFKAIKFMAEHPECGLLSPSARWDDGTPQHLCKRYPTLLDLFLRAFAPAGVKRLFAGRLQAYQMEDVSADAGVLWDPPIVSGCFMLVRSDVLRTAGGFDSRFFLYFEDFDLSLRIGRISRIAHVPAVKIIHHGGNAGRKGLRHVYLFCRSSVVFFRMHGWKWC